MAGITVREQAIFVEVEAVYNTAETLVAADALAVQDLRFNPAESARLLERQTIRESLNAAKALYGGALLGFQFAAELKGSGSAGTAPQALGDLLRACGMSETVVASTSVTYAPEQPAHEGCTIGLKQGGNYRIARGCRGSVSFTLAAGQICLANFNMIGHIESETEAAAPTPSYESTVPPAFTNAAFTIASTEFPISQMTLDMANNLAVADDPNSSDSFGEIRITNRQAGGQIDPEEQLINTKDLIGIYRAGTSQALATGVIGASAGNRFALNVPLAYWRSPQYADRDELIVVQIDYGAEDTDGTDDFSLQFT